jgi:hypothetical protein
MKTNSQTKKFNLPAYVNTPLFLYQDERLDKPATTIASLIYSFHASGKEISASTDYFCALAKTTKRHLSRILNQLEELNYIKRSGYTNKREIKWTYNPKSKIIITEDQTRDMDVASEETRDMDDPKLGTCESLNYGHAGHTNIKEDIKEDIKDLYCAFPSESTLSSFELFWKTYPTKRAKKKCLEIWKRRKLDSIADEILEKLNEQVKSDAQWKKGFIPNPATYLNQDRWQDEITISQEQRNQIKYEQRLLEQEKIIEKQNRYEQDKQQQYNKDGAIFRSLSKEVHTRTPRPMPEGFKLLKQAVGIK